MSYLDITLQIVVFPLNWIAILSFLPVLVFVLGTLNAPRNPKGCRRLGLPPGQSNLDDEFDSKYSQGVPNDKDDHGRPSWRVKALFSYPLKSCGAVELQASNVVSTGLEFDRQFVFAKYNKDEWDIRPCAMQASIA